MLMFFEGVLCQQRVQSLQMLRAVRRDAIPIHTFRGGRWEVISSYDIVPGDVISLTSSSSAAAKGRSSGGSGSNGGLVMPCDALIIRGSCVVNEAMLTGESVPQVKESLRTAAPSSSSLVDTAALGTKREGKSSEGAEGRYVDLGDDSSGGSGGNANAGAGAGDSGGMEVWRRHLVYSGTTITQHTETLVSEEEAAAAHQLQAHLLQQSGKPTEHDGGE
jgi:magnesium-transporting ATPase (P-type)